MKRLNPSVQRIGMVRRGGLYSPSNERSEEKIRIVLADRGFIVPGQLIFDDVQMAVFRDQARQAGYRVMVIERGLGR